MRRRRDNRGAAFIVALGFLGTMMVLSLAALTLARPRLMRGHRRLAELKAIYLLQSAVTAASFSDFQKLDEVPSFSTGTVQLKKCQSVSLDDICLEGRATVGSFSKTVQVGWTRVGGTWQATYWRELI